MYTKLIQLDANQIQFEVQNLSSKSSFVDPVTKMEFIYVPGGWYKMGDIFGDGENDEKTVYDVHLNGFFMGKYLVTLEQWKIVMNKNPPNFKKDNDYRYNYFSWEDSQLFIQKLNSRSKENLYRLPTKAEWEFASRDFATRRGNEHGENLNEEYNYTIGYDSPNDLGINDMSAGVNEWCEDVYQDDSYSNHEVHNKIFKGKNNVSQGIRGGGWYVNESRRIAHHRVEIKDNNMCCINEIWYPEWFRLAFSPR